jgi:tetratricopeptide (TPR) repeat protein
MFSELVKDYERMLVYYIQEKEYEKAINILKKQSSLDLYYKFSPVLMKCMPYETVNMWIHEPKLNPRHLIPSLLKYDPQKSFGKEGIEGKNQAIRYLNYVIQNLHNTDVTIHNYLLSLYAKQSTNEDCSELLEFLIHENKPAYYDLQYALRICTQYGIIHACVYIYSEMKLYEQAVNLSLKHDDIDLAKYNADKVENNDPLRKKLWINIVKYVIEEKKDIKTALQLLKSCELLKISDILPFFPDFVLIEDFKDEICETLEEYNVHIDELKKEMDEATKSAEDIRFDIRELKNKHTIIPVNELCRICNKTLLTRQFYIFPCQHLFHADCLLNSLLESYPLRRNKRIKMLYDQINELNKKLNGTDTGVEFLINDSDSDDSSENNNYNVFNSATTTLTMALKTGGIIRSEDEKKSEYNQKVLEKLKEELQELITSECPLCGDSMISSIDLPFLDSSRESELIASWEI